MNIKLLAALTAALVIAGGNIATAQEESAADKLGLEIGAYGTIVLQGTPKVNSQEKAKGENDLAYSFDITIGKDLGGGASVFSHLVVGQGDGLSSVFSYTNGVNGDVWNTDNVLTVAELYYKQTLLDEKLSVTIGKINPALYFDQNAYANDETAQFINYAFVSNPLIVYPLDFYKFGVNVTYSPIEKLEFSYSYLETNSDLAHFDTRGFNTIQLAFKPNETGNYRIFYWNNNDANFVYADVKNREFKEGVSGFGISADQQITETIGLFARFGYRDPSIAVGTGIDTDDDGEIDDYDIFYAPSSIAASIGAQFLGSAWSRDNDRLGIALGFANTSKDIFDNTDLEKDGSEVNAEIYYAFAINENVIITPSLQYLNNTYGGNTPEDNVFVYGIRTQIGF
ncbi:MAG: carbohydrate porin [Endomicrobium sp.]|jgi:carbohydrate-selective porin OprB|nr:carbohydrate porin [Endomicrobium sp.]